MRFLRPSHRLLSSLGIASLVAASVAPLAACGGDPLVVVGRVDISVADDVTLIVDFPVTTRLVRSPRSINASIAGECTVTRNGFDTLIARDETGTGLRSLRVSSDGASVDIGGVTYSALEADAGCFIQARAADPSYGSVTFDIDCTLDDGAGESVSAIGVLTFEGCH